MRSEEQSVTITELVEQLSAEHPDWGIPKVEGPVISWPGHEDRL
jgi:hypothetical protein